MIVKKIELLLISKKLKHPFKTSFGTTYNRKILLVKMFTDGEVGWGECVAGEGPWYSYETYETAMLVIRKYLSKLILGKNFDNLGELSLVMDRVRGHNMAKTALEEAFLDAYTKQLNVPLYKHLGGVRNKIKSGVSVGIQKDIPSLINLISSYLDEGYKRIKIKIEPGWDVNVLKSIREEFGDIPLQVDANAAYTLKDINTLKQIDNFNLLMIEQPLHYNDLYEHSLLRRELKTPICLDESIKDIYCAEAAIALKSVDIINIKPGRVGGIVSAKAIHDLAEKNGIGVWIGGMLETGIGRSFLVALASLPNVKYPNDVSASSRYWDEDIVEPEFVLNKDGTIDVPSGPGIGVNVLEDKIEKLTLKKIEIS